MSKKYYFLYENDEVCNDIDYVKNYMKKHGIKEIEIFKAKPYRVEGKAFYCVKYGLCGDDTFEHCGNECSFYEPRNGKSGVCIYHRHWFYEPGEKIKINL